jgi:hypothetical protein
MICMADGWKGFYERPIFALILMVSHFADAASQRQGSQVKMGDVEKETDQEYLAAKQLIDVILGMMGRTLFGIAVELATFREHWMLPGPEIDLSFLASCALDSV